MMTRKSLRKIKQKLPRRNISNECKWKMNIYPAYISKYNLNNEKQVSLLTIQSKERWHYLEVISSEDTKMLEFNQIRKCHKTSCTIYVETESLIKRKDGFKTNIEK